MKGKRIIVIGAGLSGLICGRILSGRGLQVTILEQGRQAGGALQTFVRDGIRFDTGFHSVGGLGPGEPLDVIFRMIGLDSLPWIRMEADEIIGGDTPFLRLSSGWEEERKHVLEPYNKSIWRLEGGGKTLVDALAKGQEILLEKKVTAIENRCVSCSNGSVYQADAVISSIHPAVTLQLLRDKIRPAYIRRILGMKNGPGVFTVYAKLRPGSIKHVNHSIFLDNTLMIHFGEADPEGYARSLDLLCFASASGLDPESLARTLILKAAERLPGLQDNIEKHWISTPQTWQRYTGTPGGSAYGILKHDRLDFIAPQTPIPWLYLTGQNLGLHGILGTTISALNTCKSIEL